MEWWLQKLFLEFIYELFSSPSPPLMENLTPFRHLGEKDEKNNRKSGLMNYMEVKEFAYPMGPSSSVCSANSSRIPYANMVGSKRKMLHDENEGEEDYVNKRTSDCNESDKYTTLLEELLKSHQTQAKQMVMRQNLQLLPQLGTMNMNVGSSIGISPVAQHVIFPFECPLPSMTNGFRGLLPILISNPNMNPPPIGHILLRDPNQSMDNSITDGRSEMSIEVTSKEQPPFTPNEDPEFDHGYGDNDE